MLCSGNPTNRFERGTMNINNVSSASVSASVWSANNRTLTSDPAGPVGVGGTGSVSAGATVDFRAPSGNIYHISFFQGTNAVAVAVGEYNGSTFTGAAINGSNQFGFTFVTGDTSGNGVAVNNTGAITSNYSYAGIIYV